MVITAESKGRQRASARSLTTVVDFAVGSHARAVVVLLAVALLGFLPGFSSIPPVDRDEARFAQATKQMVESGDYVDIRFQDEVRYKKPVGVYWVQAAVVKAASALGFPDALTTIWLYRVPSLIGSTAAVLLTYWAALAFVSRRAAVLAGLMMASCVLLGIERLLAKTDALLLMTVVAAMGAMGRAYLWRERRDTGRAWTLAAIFWTALGTGVLLKGPLVVMVVGLAALALILVDRSARWLLTLKPLAGSVWFALLVLHGAPPGYYFALFWVSFWPGATLAALATPAVWQARREAAVKFLLAWLVPSWLVLELVVTKLPHYVLPLYPPIAILIAGVIDARGLSRKSALEWGTIWWFIVPVVAGVAGIVALAAIGRQFGLLAWPVVGAAAVLGFFAWRLYQADGAELALLRGVAAAILTAIAIFGLVVPSLGQLFPSPTLARILRESGCTQPQAAAVGYQEPSVVFLAGTATRLVDVAGAAEFLRGGECRFVFIEASQERSFSQRAEAIGLRYWAGPRVDAINISTGRPITIAVFHSAGSS
ncbi:MAG: glycosyltransferase family 39 protein [Alphaproteobacteria bacterium]|nr:MAG: glycosyltransferase family 39 protein [Alphaproteobacteria bacterium]